MPRKPNRDWLTTDEGAEFLGLSVSRFRDFINERILPHSEMTANGWLHYLGDLEKLKEYREKNPPPKGRKKFERKPLKIPRMKKGESANADDSAAQAGNFPAENRPVTEDAAAPTLAQK